MKILIVSQYFWPEDFKVNDIAFDYAARGYEVTVLTAKPNYPKGRFYDGYGLFSRKSETHRGVKIIRTPIIPRKDGGAFFLALNYLSFVFFSFFTTKFRVNGFYDIIFCHLTSPITAALPAIWLKKKFQIPLVIWVLDLWPESVENTTNIKNRHFYRYLTNLVKYVYAQSDHILVSSRYFINSVKEKLEGNKVPISYFPNWAEDIFVKNSEDNTDLPTLPEGFNIMFAGNIGEAQDFESIVFAAKKTQAMGINWIIIGDGRKNDWLKKEIAKNDITNMILLGRFPLNTMPNFFKKADAMLVTLKDAPIFRLTVPAKIQAYMASSKIILGMINGEAGKLIKDSGGGYAVPAGDSLALAAKAIALMNIDSVTRENMEKNSRNYYRKHFSKELLFQKLETVFENQLESDIE